MISTFTISIHSNKIRLVPGTDILFPKCTNGSFDYNFFSQQVAKPVSGSKFGVGILFQPSHHRKDMKRYIEVSRFQELKEAPSSSAESMSPFTAIYMSYNDDFI